jgi:DNA polymerase-3 subunit epsilon
MPSYAVVIDTETTGLDPTKHEIVQVAAICIMYPELIEVARFSATMRPLTPWTASPKALEVNGLDLDTLAAEGEHPGDTARKFQMWLKPYGRVVPIAYNWEFDRKFLAAWCNINWSYRQLDMRALVMAHLYMQARVPDEKLATAAKYMGYTEHNAHDAMGDVEATLYLLRRMTRRQAPKEVPSGTPQ